MGKVPLAISLIFVLLILVPPAHAQQNLTVLRDETHGQFYTMDSFSTIVDSLKDAGINVGAITSDFVGTLNGSDPQHTIVIIPNPEDGNFSTQDIAAIKSFVEAGGVVILMSDVQYSTSSGPRQYGRPGTLNQVVFGIDANAPVRFEGTDDNGNEIYDDVNNDGRSRQIKVSPDLIAPVIRSGIADDIITTTSMVHASDSKYVLAFTAKTAYAKALDGSIIMKGNIPRIAYFDYGNGKVILSGTTRGFSDTMISLSPDTKILFINIISRASGVTVSVTTLKSHLPLVDVLTIRLVMSAVVLYDARYQDLERKERVNKVLNVTLKYGFLIAVAFALLAALQAYLMKAVYITTLYPGRSQPTSLTNVPMWANALAKYFFAAMVDVAIGLFLGLVVLRIEKLRELMLRYRKLLRVV